MAVRKKSFFTAIILELGILLFFLLKGIFFQADLVKEFTANELSTAQETNGELELYESSGLLDNTFLGSNRRIFTPTLKLREGIYQVDVFFQTDTPNTSTTGGRTLAISKQPEWIESESVLLTSSAEHVDYRFYVKRNNVEVSMRILLDDEIYDTITIDRIVISSMDGQTLTVFLLKLLSFFGVIDFLLLLSLFRQRIIVKMSSEKIIILIGLLTLFFVAELPMTMNYLPKGYDLRFHYYRIYSMASGLREGIFPVKIQPEWVNGYGYATGTFYGDIFLYLPAVLYVIGFPLHTAYKIYIFSVNLLTVGSSFFCFKSISGDEKIGLMGATIYTMSLHRLVATYTRAALGATSAMAFAPFVILGLWYIYQATENHRKNGWIYLTIGLSGILETHVLGTLMTGTFIILFMLLNFRKTIQAQTLKEMLKACVAILLLNLFFIVPMIDLYINTPLFIHSEYRSISQYSAFISQMFSSVYNAVGDVREDLVGMYHDMPMTLGPIALFIVVGSIACIYIYRDEKNRNVMSKLVGLLTISLWLSSNLFPYQWLEVYIPSLFYVFMKFEFAWRFLAVATVLLALLFVLILSILRTKLSYSKVVLIGSIVALLYMYQGASYIFQYDDSMIPFEHEEDFRNLSVGAVYDGQYLPEGFDIDSIDCSITVSEPKQMLLTVQNEGKLHYQFAVKNQQDTKGYVEFPLIPYKGYHAKYEEGKNELQIMKDSTRRIRVEIPERFDGSIELFYSEPWYWRVAELVSFFTLIIFIVYTIRDSRRPKQEEKDEK